MGRRTRWFKAGGLYVEVQQGRKQNSWTGNVGEENKVELSPMGKVLPAVLEI